MQEKIDYTMEPGLKIEKNFVNNDPVISIVTAYFNSSKYIIQTAYSIINQTLENWEWIIVDDGSTEENTNDIFNYLKSLDQRIKIYRKDNEGPAIAIKYGIKKANCEFVCIIDSDDLFDKTFLECAYWSLITNPKASWVYSNVIAFGEDEYIWNPEFDVKREKKENIIPSAGLIRKNAFTQIGDYNCEKNEYHQDWKTWLLFLRKNLIPIRLNYYGFWYRRRASGRLKTILKQPEKRQVVLDKLQDISKDISDDIEGINFPYAYTNCDNKINIDMSNICIYERLNNILLFIPKLNNSEINKRNLENVKKLTNEYDNIFIITTEECEYDLRHEFEKYAVVYDLTSFLSINYWQDFIDYIIKKNKILGIISIGINYLDFSFSKKIYNDIPMIKICDNDNYNNIFRGYDYVIKFDETEQICDIIKNNEKNLKDRQVVSDYHIYLDYIKNQNKITFEKEKFEIELEDLRKDCKEKLLEKENECQNIIKDIKSIINEKNMEIQRQNNIIGQKELELRNIYSGKTWKIASKMSKIIKKLKRH